MTRAMTKDEARAWQHRWAVIAAHEREELRRTPPEEKLRQCAALIASASRLGWLGNRRNSEEAAWERWRCLKERLAH